MPKIGIFTTVTDPKRRGDNYRQALKCYEEFTDYVEVVDGKYTWPQEFDWKTIGFHFQEGYERCYTDWVIHMDLDFLFHEKDFDAIRKVLDKNNDAPAVSFYKWQFTMPDRYNLKSRLVLAVNKKKFNKRIKFNGGGDLCQPTLDGVDIDIDSIPASGIAFYNYEKLTKNAAQIADDVGRMDRAYFRHFGKYLYGTGDDTSAFDGWIKMARGRLTKPHQYIELSEHPKFIRKTIKNLKPEHWGYDGFGLVGKNNYVA